MDGSFSNSLDVPITLQMSCSTPANPPRSHLAGVGRDGLKLGG